MLRFRRTSARAMEIFANQWIGRARQFLHAPDPQNYAIAQQRDTV